MFIRAPGIISVNSSRVQVLAELMDDSDREMKYASIEVQIITEHWQFRVLFRTCAFVCVCVFVCVCSSCVFVCVVRVCVFVCVCSSCVFMCTERSK